MGISHLFHHYFIPQTTIIYSITATAYLPFMASQNTPPASS